MTRSIYYESPSSEVILLSAPLILTGTSGYIEDTPGNWENDED